MANREVAKGRMLYKNGLAGAQPDFTDVKLKDDLKLIAELDRCLADVEGQEYACHAVKEQLFGNMNRENRDGPAAVFFFTGPSAVGKTLLAQKIAQALGRPFERLDMSAYSDREAFISLFGLNKFYKSSAPGRLTAFIKGNPVSVILMDEIEKAHITVRNHILQMFDKGAVYDLYYEKDFSVRDCILIFTSGVGANIYNTGNPYNLSATPVSVVIKALESEKNPATREPYFSRDLVSRFASGKIIVFNKLRPEVLHRIAVKQIEEIRDYYRTAYNIGSKIDADALADVILFSQGGDADVRSVVRAVKEFFSKNFERLAETVNSSGCGGRIGSVRYNIALASATSEAAEILADGAASRVLVFGGGVSGSIPKELAARIEIIPAPGGMSVHDIKKIDPAIALVGITDKNGAEAKELFENLTAVGIPAYVYTKAADLSITDYAENGAVDCFTPRKAINFKIWASGAVRGINLRKAESKLFRTNKVITFSVSYKYSKRTCAADITLSDFAAQIAYGGRGSSLFSGRSAIPDVTFEDIIGADEAKREFAPVIRQLRNYSGYARNGIRIPRGILLDGPPGSGKTSIAKAVANAAKLPFISLDATEFLSKWIGEGEQKIRDIFAEARRYAPSIIFIDEIDCITKDRMNSTAFGVYTGGLTNAFLSELDGVNSEDGAPVFVIAATNFDTHSGETLLDKAFLRRFDKKIHIGLPKAADREKFISRELSRYDFCTVSRGEIAGIVKRSVGWSLADLNLVIQNAVRHSENGSGFSLTDPVLEEAFASFNAGGRKMYDEETVRKTAYHEAGHIVAAELLGLKPAYATIVARSGYGGYIQYSEEDKFDLTREECLNRICVSLAGRAGEVCFYGSGGITTGAGGDLRSASEMAMRMVCAYGMEEDMLFCIEEGKAAENAAVCTRVQRILAEQYSRALALIRGNADKADAVAKALIERESLNDTELSEIISSIGEVYDA